MDRFSRTWLVPLCCALLAAARPARAQAADPVHWSWADPDHPSAVYHAKDPGRLTLFVDNTSPDPQPLAGKILFGTADPAPPALPATQPADNFKTLAVTPLTPATLQPGQRAKITLTLPFAAAGNYQLRLSANGAESPILNPAGLTLQCIFPPRTPTAAQDSPWLTPLPKAAAQTPGLLTDYIRQTSARRFLLDERFAFDPAANLGLAFGSSLNVSARDVDALLGEAALAKAALVVRITLPTDADPRTVAAFRQYLTDMLARAKGAVRAVAIAPDFRAPPDPAAYRTLYLAAYETLKRADKSILMLGAGSALSTQQLLLAQHLDAYIDALAVTDTAAQPALLSTIEGPKRPLWILPPNIPDPWPLLPPAAALAQGAAVITLPPPTVDRGVTAHLLGGAVLFQRVRLATPMPAQPDQPEPPDFIHDLPYIAVFQGDGYAVAAVAGFSAGTDLDAQFPGLAQTRTRVEPTAPTDEPAYPNLEVGDDTRTMRVVDTQGSPVDCRVGDQLFIPAGDHIMYLLQAGTADELAGSIRVADTNRLPTFDLKLTATADTISLHLHNLSAREVTGNIRLLRPLDNAPPEILAQRPFPVIPPGQSLDLPLNLTTPLPDPTHPFLVEITTPITIQRTALQITK